MTSRRSRRAALPALAVVACLSWGGVHAADELDPAWLAMRDCPDEPGCHALVLLDEVELNNESNRTRYASRRVMKLFTKDSVERYADVGIRSEVGGWEVKNLSGRTILPDGKVIPLRQENISVKHLRRGKRREKVKNANFPGVVPGAIIAYSYDLVLEPLTFISEDRWDIQYDLPVLESRYILKQGKLQLGWSPGGLEKVQVEHTSPFKNVNLFRAARIPPIPEEPLGPPAGALRARQYFYMPELQRTWLGVMAGRAAGRAGDFIDGAPGVAGKVKELTTPEDAAIGKVRKIYRFVQESIGTEEQRADPAAGASLQDARNAGEVLARGYGSEYERTLLFLALVKAAGLEQGLLVIASRYVGPLNQEIPDETQFDSFAAAVKTGSSWTFYDPATRHCPFGMIAAEKEGGAPNAVLLVPQRGAGRQREARVQNLVVKSSDPVPFSLAAIPFSGAGKNVLLREARVSLSAEGSAEVEVSDQGTGLVDLDHRQTYEPLDEERRRAALTERVRESLPGAELLAASFEAIDGFDRTATIRYRLKLPSAGSAVADRLLLSPSLFHAARANPFTSAARRTPVHFGHARKSQERIVIELPPGYEPEELPAPVVVRDPPFVLTMSVSREAEGLVLTRREEVDAAVWPVADYTRLKSFFEKVHEADRTTIALRRGAVP